MKATMFLTMLCNRSEMPQSFLFDEVPIHEGLRD